MVKENNRTNPTSSKPKDKDKIATVVLALLFLLVIGTVIANTLGYYFLLEWVGVVNQKTGEIKTLWDWMELLLVPLVLAFGAFLLSKSEKAHERKIAEQQLDNERELAEKRAETEQELAKDNQQQTVLEAYFDRMTDLLLNKDLCTSKKDDKVRTIARTRTITVLKGLDGRRRGQVLQFLYEAGLINRENPIIDISFADLRQIDLSYAYLENINAPKANLRKANLRTAQLMGANFYFADLDEADLSWADLRNANLQCGLKKADLGVAKLDGATLFNADLSGACFTNASLVSADLSYANLKYINEGLGDMVKDNILYADLALADLSGCNLTGAILDVLQLRGVRALKGATMPDGTKFEEWIKIHKYELEGG